LARLRDVAPQHERAAVFRRRARVGRRPDDSQPVAFEAERSHERRIDGCAVRERRAFESGCNLAGQRAAPDAVALLDHGRLQAGAREQRRGHEPVHAAAYDDDVGHDRCPRILSAALRPGAPMMPPPGCVAEPHIHSFRMGVSYCAQPGTGRAKKSCSSVSSPWKMLPSVSPNTRSRSGGVSTCRCRMMSRMFGAYSAIVSTTVSPNASRCSSHVPDASLYGAYCTKHDRMCLPGGATEGSVSVGMTMSMYGRRENSPYFAWSYPPSMHSTLAEIDSA